MKVGFIGLGMMGGSMAANLGKAGHAVQSFDLNGKGSRKSVREASEEHDLVGHPDLSGSAGHLDRLDVRRRWERGLGQSRQVAHGLEPLGHPIAGHGQPFAHADRRGTMRKSENEQFVTHAVSERRK